MVPYLITDELFQELVKNASISVIFKLFCNKSIQSNSDRITLKYVGSSLSALSVSSNAYSKSSSSNKQIALFK